MENESRLCDIVSAHTHDAASLSFKDRYHPDNVYKCFRRLYSDQMAFDYVTHWTPLYVKYLNMFYGGKEDEK